MTPHAKVAPHTANGPNIDRRPDTKEWSIDDVPDCIWYSDNEWGIPLLDLQMQAQAVEVPVTQWGSIARKSRLRGTIAFYVEDYRFEALWSDPSGIANLQHITNIIEPNFTTTANMPAAMALHQVYKKRWLARWWQSIGIRVFVDLNVAPEFVDLNMLGVPTGWRAYATRATADRLSWLDNEYQLACEWAESKNILFLVFGGGKTVKEYCRSKPGLIWTPDQRDQEQGISGTA
jgi:hypothetical protein